MKNKTKTTVKKANALRAKKLKYNTLKYKLQRAKLWGRYLKDARDGLVPRGTSMQHMEEMLNERDVLKDLAGNRIPRTKDEVAEAFNALADAHGELPNEVKTASKLLALSAKYESLSKERAAVATQIRGLLV